ncbi:MAG: PilW family protein [Rhodocyclaceae bacterium]|nr:PilW family protein [Rhodocyclaceae bacterium]
MSIQSGKVCRGLRSTAKQGGVTLVELMIAMAISLFMIGAVLYVVFETQVSYRTNDHMGRVQESGRIGAEIITHDVRMAGFFGCLPPESQVVIKAFPPPNGQRTLAGLAMRGFVLPDATASLLAGGQGVAASSVFVFRSGGPNPVGLAADLGSAGAPLVLTGNPDGIQPGDLVAITDCEAADIFRASAVAGTVIQHGGGVNTTALLSKQYGMGARVMRIREEAYYVGNTGRVQTDGSPVFSLYRVRVTTNGAGDLITAGIPADEIVENITDMRAVFGVDSDADRQIDAYLQAAAIGTQWGQVRAFRTDLLAESEDSASREPKPFTYDGEVLPASKRLRQSFELVTAMRNLLN